MARRKMPPAPPKKKRAMPTINYDPMARALVSTLREAHGADQAATLDMSEEIARPRGYIGTRNAALDRALGTFGIPQGLITEISGWEGSGKSTVLDQIYAQCQAEGGLGVLADTEKARDRKYMTRLGIQDSSLIWIQALSIEQMFDEVETTVRKIASWSAIAWAAALQREGLKCPDPPRYKHRVFDPNDPRPKAKRKPVAEFSFGVWGRGQAAALMEFQRVHWGVDHAFGIRDSRARAALRPVLLFGTELEQEVALEAWRAGDPHPLAVSADRPTVVGWDSVAGTPTERELDGDARAEHVAAAAKVIKRNFRRLVQLFHNEAIAFVLVNQRYAKIDTSYTPGRPKVQQSETYGGSGIKYHSAIRIELDKIGNIWASAKAKEARDPPIGQIVRIKVPKNKVNSPHHTEEFGLIYGRGADNAWAISEDLKRRGIITQGGWSKFTDPTILGGANKAWQGGWMVLSNMMAADPALWTKLHKIYMEGRPDGA